MPLYRRREAVEREIKLEKNIVTFETNIVSFVKLLEKILQTKFSMDIVCFKPALPKLFIKSIS